jgi:uncharacterized membrane-anchored protein
MELDKLKELLAQSQEQNRQIAPPEQSSQAIQKILKMLKSEMLILSIFAGISLLSTYFFRQASQRYFMIYVLVLSILLMGFLGFFYSKIKHQNRLDLSLRAVLENQIKSIKSFMKVYYLSTFFVLSLRFFWKEISLAFLIILGVTLSLVKWWLKKFYTKPLLELEKTIVDLDA